MANNISNPQELLKQSALALYSFYQAWLSNQDNSLEHPLNNLYPPFEDLLYTLATTFNAPDFDETEELEQWILNHIKTNYITQ